MRQSLFHLSRDSARMFSGAAGLFAAFAAVSLPILAFQGAGASHIILSRTVVVPGLMLCLAFLASGLLRFSLMRDDPAAVLRSHAFTAGMRSLSSRRSR